MNRNLKIVIGALAIAMWYNATARLYDLLIPHVDWFTTSLMFFVATVVLLYDDGTLSELGGAPSDTGTSIVPAMISRTPQNLPPILAKAARKPGTHSPFGKK